LKTGLLLSHSSEFIDKLQAYFEEGHTKKRPQTHIHSERGRMSANDRVASSIGRLGVAKFQATGMRATI
jgi:hypothetical protein